MHDLSTSRRRAAADQLVTSRLRLRRWREDDETAIAELSGDPEVRRYLNPAAGPYVERFEAHWREHGFGLWAVQRLEPEAECIGFVGLAYPKFLPAVAHRPEIGWRLARSAWGQGLAGEAALAVRDHALGPLGLPGLISIIHPENRRSQRVAAKLGMSVTQHVHNPVMGVAVEIWSLGA
jgi:RimJ/RimL family protein N-acetyltransferase